MALTVTLNGTNYSVPEPNDTGYGTALAAYLKALATAFPQLGGAVALTSEYDFGATYGLKSTYFKTRASNPALSGILRLAVADTVAWRNNANGADLALAVDAADKLKFNSEYITGNPLLMANSTAGATLANNTVSTVVFGTVETDTDSAYNSGTGTFTVPTGKGGHYFVSCSIAFAVAFTPGTNAFVRVKVNGVVKRAAVWGPIATGALQSFTFSAMVSPTAGQTILVEAFQDSGAGRAYSVAPELMNLTIKRITT